MTHQDQVEHQVEARGQRRRRAAARATAGVASTGSAPGSTGSAAAAADASVEPLLVDVVDVAEPGAPARSDQPQPEIEVLVSAPRRHGSPQGRPRRQSRELPLPPRPGGADPVPGDLDEPAETDELDVLHPGQDVGVGVRDPDTDLDRPDARVARSTAPRAPASAARGARRRRRSPGRRRPRSSVEPRVAVVQPPRTSAVGVVEDLALALPRLGRAPDGCAHPRVALGPLGPRSAASCQWRRRRRRGPGARPGYADPVSDAGSHRARAPRCAQGPATPSVGVRRADGRVGARNQETANSSDVVGDDRGDDPADGGQVDGHPASSGRRGAQVVQEVLAGEVARSRSGGLPGLVGARQLAEPMRHAWARRRRPCCPGPPPGARSRAATRPVGRRHCLRRRHHRRVGDLLTEGRRRSRRARFGISSRAGAGHRLRRCAGWRTPRSRASWVTWSRAARADRAGGDDEGVSSDRSRGPASRTCRVSPGRSCGARRAGGTRTVSTTGLVVPSSAARARRAGPPSRGRRACGRDQTEAAHGSRRGRRGRCGWSAGRGRRRSAARPARRRRAGRCRPGRRTPSGQ